MNHTGFGRIHPLQILTLAALVMLTAVALLPLQRAITVRMEELKSELVYALEEQLERRISYSGISPSVFRYLDVRDLRVLGDNGEREVLLDIGRVRAYYRFFDLFSDEPLRAVTELRLENTNLSLDHRQDADVIEFFSSVLRANGGARDRESAASPFDRLRVRGRNMTVRYRGPEAEHVGSGVSLLLELQRGGVNVAVGGDFAYHHRVAGSFVADGASIDGVLLENAARARLTLDLPTVRTPAVRVVDQTYQLDYDGRTVEAHKIRDRSPIDVSFVFDRETAAVELDFLADGMVPASILEFHGASAVFNPWLLGETSGRGRLRHTLGTDQLSYDLHLTNRVRNPEVAQPVTVSAAVRGDTTGATFEHIALRSNGGHAVFQGEIDFAARLPRGTLDLGEFQYGRIQPVTASFQITPENGRTVARAATLRYASTDLHGVELAWSGGNPGMTYRALAYLDAERSGRVELSGRTSAGAQPQTDLLLEFRNAPLTGPLSVAADIVLALPAAVAARVPQSIILDSRVILSMRGEELRVSAPFVSLFDAEQPDRYAAFGLYSSDTSFEIRDAIFGSGEYLLRGGVFANIGTDGRVDFSAELLDGERSYEIDGLVNRDHSVIFRGSYGLDGRATLTDDELLIAARAQEMPLPFSDNGTTLSFDMTGRYRSPTAWNAAVHQLALVDLVAPGGRPVDVELDGRFHATGGQVERIVVRDAVSTIRGSGTAQYALGGGGLNSVELRLANADTAEQYELQAMFSDGSLTAAVVFERSPLARVGLEDLRGSVNGVMTVDGPPLEPRITADFQVVDGAFGNDAFSANGRIEYHDMTVTLDAIRGQYVTNTLTGGRGTLDLRNSVVELQATLRNNARPRSEPRTVQLRGSLESDDPDAYLPALLAGPFRGTVAVEGLEIFPDRYGDWTFAVDRTAERMRLHGGPSNAMTATLQETGQFRVEVRDPLPIRFIASGSLRDGELEANITQVMVNIGEVPDLFDLRALAIYDGTITGGVRVVGSLNDPDLYGTLTAENVRGNLEFLRDPIGPAKVFLVLQEKQLQLSPFTAPVGNGSGTLRGVIVLHRWTVDEYQIDIQTDEVGVPVRYTFGGLSVDGYGVGSMRIAGAPGVTNISGDIEARATTLAVSTRDEPREPDPATLTTVDLTLRTGRRVEFLWPSREFPVVRSFAQANERLALEYSDDAGTFRLRGNVGIQGGEIYYFDRNFYIREGNIVFDETEEQFDPRLRARAELREVGRDGPVRIFLIADGARLSEFSPRFESTPTMSDTEIASLIGGSLITGSADDVFNISTAMLATTDLVSPLGIMSGVESSIRDALRLDLFSVRTQLFQNLVVGALDDTGNDPLDNTSPSLGQYLDNTTVFLGKYLGSSLFLELLVQIRARNPLETEVRTVSGIEVDSEIGLEFQTPFFDLHWSIMPQNPQTLFVSDTMFSFSWGFSY